MAADHGRAAPQPLTDEQLLRILERADAAADGSNLARWTFDDAHQLIRELAGELLQRRTRTPVVDDGERSSHAVVTLDGSNEFLVQRDDDELQVGLGGDPPYDNWGFVTASEEQVRQMRDALTAVLNERHADGVSSDVDSGEHDGPTATVPRRFLQEVSIALAAASTIGLRDGTHLNYGNQDRLRQEADHLLETQQ